MDRERRRAEVIAAGRRWLEVDLSAQRLVQRLGDRVEREYPVSTAANGPGELEGSGCTPRGWHTIRARIGDGLPMGSVFVARRPTGEIYSEALARAFPKRDWILTRILWLSGLEVGFNRLGDRDTMRRFIYIHGCPDSAPMGTPLSHGCVRMRNQDVIELFSDLTTGTPVYIHE